MTQNFYVLKTLDSILARDFIPVCTNDKGRKEAAILHTITDIKFDQFIDYQYGAAEPVETVIDRQTIWDGINKPISGSSPDYLEFTWDTTTHEITFTPKLGEPEANSPGVEYSVCLFRGIDLLDALPESFVFYKAKDREGEDTIVFKSMKTGKVVHYYDLSNDKP